MHLFESPFFGISLTIFAYWLGVGIQKKTKLILCNALVLSVLFIALILQLFKIPYEAYFIGGSWINLLLIPTTVCLGHSIYSNITLLKQNWFPILIGCAAGVITSVGSILLLCRVFQLEKNITASLFSKSVTTPIAIAVSEGHGGIASITVAAVIFTGIMGNLTAPLLIKLFRVKNPIAIGLGIGASSHAIGTAKALELGDIEGSMSGLAMSICGIFTVLASLAFSLFT